MVDVSTNGEIPLILQAGPTDCGLACLAMVLGFHGCPVPLAELHRTVPPRGLLDAATLLETAGRYGLDGQGLELPVAALAELRRGSILHWRIDHFVVFDRVLPEGVLILDPALGRRQIDAVELNRRFTGVALEFSARPRWAPSRR